MGTRKKTFQIKRYATAPSINVTMLFCFLFSVMVIVACFSYGMLDYSSYEVFYERVGVGFVGGYQMERGYVFLENIGNIIGLSFAQFRAIYLGIAIILITSSIYKYSNGSSFWVLMLYIIYPFLFDIVQMRHFMASAIMVYALRFLQRKKRGDALKYIFFIIIASTQHLAALVYLLLIIVTLDIRITTYFKCCIVIIASEIFVFTGISYGFLEKPYQAIIKIFSQIREDHFYLIGTINGSVYKHYLLMIGLMVLLAFISAKERKYKLAKTPIEYNNFKWMLKISMSALCLIPFIQISDHFLRTFRALLIMISLTSITFSRVYKRGKVGRIAYSLAPWILIATYAFMFLSPRAENYFMGVTVPVLKNNRFLEWLGRL